ncbi:hypothetical protein AB0A95_33800 [Micromonospora sp. NPDC049230]|uniref:hypothetical protein n=1 Tax=Micromonospora sp. NPDC049230 TaxID=3155502 RepID=UPI0033EC4282
MHDLEFVLAGTGETIGTVVRAQNTPSEGSTVTLEHAILGPVRYRVAGPPDYWYRSRTGRIAKPDQYAPAAVRVYVQPIAPPR